MSRRRRKSATTFSLFAFQDIITAVTGIVVLITLFLAIELMERSEGTPTSQTQAQSKQTQQSIEQMQQQIAMLEKQIGEKESGLSDLPTTDIRVLKSMLNDSTDALGKINEEISRNSKGLDEKEKELKAAKGKSKDSGKADEQELEELRESIKTLAKKIESIKKGGRRIFKTGDDTKTTWLVVITQTGFRAAPIGKSTKPKEFSNASQFIGWVKRLNGQSNNLYIFIKPKGLLNFESVYDHDPTKSSLHDTGVGFGYTCIGLSDEILDDEMGAGI